jgi:hypothetical protein
MVGSYWYVGSSTNNFRKDEMVAVASIPRVHGGRQKSRAAEGLRHTNVTSSDLSRRHQLLVLPASAHMLTWRQHYDSSKMRHDTPTQHMRALPRLPTLTQTYDDYYCQAGKPSVPTRPIATPTPSPSVSLFPFSYPRHNPSSNASRNEADSLPSLSTTTTV